MKVLQLVSNPGVGGTESFVIGLTTKLRELGLDVHLANLWDGGGEAIEICARGIPCHALEFGKRKFRLGAPWMLRRFLSRERFDLVMAYGLRVTLLLRVAARFKGRPVLVTGLRGMDAWRRWQHVWADRLTDRWMDYYVGVSRAVCEAHLRREGVPLEKMLHIPNGIDTSFFRRDANPAWPSRAELGLPLTGRLCVTVAHYRAVKGYYPFQMDAISRVLAEGGAKYNDVRWVWVGEGTDEPLYKDKAAERGLADRVIVHGVSRDVRQILSHAEMFFMSSKEEGMPRGLMEAMAMRVPVMATSVGGIPEVVRDGVDGLLVPYGDVAAAAAMQRMLDSPDLRESLAASAEQHIRDEFSFDAVARKYADLYRRLVARDATVVNDYGYGS